MSSARGLAERLYVAGRIAKAKQNKDDRKLPSLHVEAADMIMRLTCTLHRERRIAAWWKTLAIASSLTLTILLAIIIAGLSA